MAAGAELREHGRLSLAGEGLREVRASKSVVREAGMGGTAHAPVRQEGDGEIVAGVDSGPALRHTALDHDGAVQRREVVAWEQ